MNKLLKIITTIAAIVISHNTWGQYISTFAGNGAPTYTGDGVVPTATAVNQPHGVAIDASGNVYIADLTNNRIRKVTAGIISTIAGTGAPGYTGDGGAATNATLFQPSEVVIDATGNIYFSDKGNNVVRKINTSGIISTIAGNGLAGYTGDGVAATTTRLNNVVGVDIDAMGNIYLGDAANQRVRKVNTAGIISTVAGTGTAGFTADGVAATVSGLWTPNFVHINAAGELLITDNGNHRIRKVNAAGIISTIAGNGIGTYIGDGVPATATGVPYPGGVAEDAAGNLYFAENGDYRVRKIDASGIISTIAGGSISGFSGDGGPATAARMTSPTDVAFDNATGFLYIADLKNNRVRIIDNGKLYFAGLRYQTLKVCQNTTANSINSLMAVMDRNVGTTATWSLYAAPVHGTAIVAYSATSTGGVLTPSGLSYIPTTGYTGTDVFKVVVSDGLISDTTTIHVTVTPIADAGTISGIGTVCVGSTRTLSETVSGGVWSSGATVVATINSAGTIYGVSAGTATISYSVTNVCGASVALFSITVNPLTVAGTITGSGNICMATVGSLSSAVAGGVWSSSTTTIATVSSSGDVTPVAIGTATISYTITDGCGTATATKVVTVITLPSAGTIAGLTSLCMPSVITLSDAIPSGMWTSGNTTVARVNSTGTVTGVSPGIATISYSVTNSCGTDVAVYIVTINALPVVGAITGSTRICLAGSGSLSNASAGGVWSSSATTIATVNSTGDITPVALGIATISYAVTNVCGTTTAIRVVTVVTLPSAGAITGASTFCIPAVITLNDAIPFGVWTSGNTSVAAVSGTGIVTGVTPGIVTISYSVTNSCGTTVAQHTVTVNGLPAAGTITGSSAMCLLTAHSLGATAVGGVWNSDAPAIATVNSVGDVTPMSIGTATISYTVTNVCGSITATRIITIDPAASAGTVSGPATLCIPATVILSSTVPGGVWSTGTTSVVTLSSTGVVTTVAPGTAVIDYRITNSCGTDVTSLTMNLLAAPAAATITGPDTVCAAAFAVMIGSGAGGIWSSSATSVAIMTTPGVVTGLKAGVTTISYNISNSCGSTTAVKKLVVNPLPVARSVVGVSKLCVGSSSSFGDWAIEGTWTTSSPAIAVVNNKGMVVGVSAGKAIITYTVSNNCGSSFSTLPVTILSSKECLAMQAEGITANNGHLDVYPNPGSGLFTISLSGAVTEQATAIITNVTGQQIKKLSMMTNAATEVNLVDIPSGIYFVAVATAHSNYTTKLVVR